MARKIASILEGGDPTQRGATKFEKQRQRAEKYAVEADADLYNGNNAYRPLRPLQTNDSFYSASPSPYYNASEVPNCIKHSLEEAQYINPLRYVGAPEEFKQMHMQVVNDVHRMKSNNSVCLLSSRNTSHTPMFLHKQR